MKKSNIQKFFDEQLKNWDFANRNYKNLKKHQDKEFIVNGCRYVVQFNPARIASSNAQVDEKSIRSRKCFLCEENIPKEQLKLPFKGRYSVMVNPFPIFPEHFTVVANIHEPQSILNRFDDMLDLAQLMSDYVVFYNGPKCGASAPDHTHFQAGNKSFLPIEQVWKNYVEDTISHVEEIKLHTVNYGFPAFFISGSTFIGKGIDIKSKIVAVFEKVYNALPKGDSNDEPMMNVLAWFNPATEIHLSETWIICIIPRSKHRPNCYFADGDNNLLISPASVDLGGVFIMPRKKDFEHITPEDIAEILNEVCLDKADFQQIASQLR
ncbi:MAG: DUF4922 domain-containing protein [Paludibacteraceae bacterium]